MAYCSKANQQFLHCNIPMYLESSSKESSRTQSMADPQIPYHMPKVITFLSSLLQREAESNDLDRPFRPQRISVFHGLTKPSISVQSYLERIFKYANCSPSCFIVAYVYLSRFAHRQPSLPVDSFNVHRLLITSVMVAAKFMDDICYNNAYYAKVGGISTREMNFLEMDFLFGVGFHLNVTPSTFLSYSSYLHRQMLLLEPPLITTPATPALKAQCYFSEDDAPPHKQQLAV
ncbi:cyclin-U4-1-like [Magnolia sinica]|uniref:cyclin-U4-1-like n=1 Tax=Magnolia sinica TaxID=86752 RepID=UPI00265A7D73|nr:cyclin-U4-1-like [Magnolia sinica]